PLLDGADRIRIEHPEPRSDWRREGHHGNRACVLESQRGDEVLVGVGEDLETFVDQRLRCLEETGSVRQQRLLIADNLELYPLVESRRARQTRVANSVACA